MSIVTMLCSAGGVARTAELRRRGVSAHTIERALRRGAVFRPRRGWLALPAADPELVFAARHGIVLSCVSQARRIGLWTLDSAERHVAASAAARADAPGCTVHWARPVLVREPGRLEDPIQNVLQLVAACRPFEEALVIWESALNKRLVDLPGLASLPLRGQARRLLEVSAPFADSGLETMLVSRLRWLGVRLVPQATCSGIVSISSSGTGLCCRSMGRRTPGGSETRTTRMTRSCGSVGTR